MQLAQTTPHILMVRPANFGFNEETAANNAFQTRDGSLTPDQIRTKALAEFDAAVSTLREAGVQVIVAEDSAMPIKPDAVFPNNWVSFHSDGTIITYPMFAEVRRLERSEAIIDTVLQAGFATNGQRVHLETYEAEGIFLEGTGSIVFDHPNQLAYANYSPRTHGDLLEILCQRIGYQAIAFHAVDGNGQDIYHANVLMAMGDQFVVICLDTIRDPHERAMVEETLQQTEKEVIEISLEQMGAFAGNMLQVGTAEGGTVLVMSAKARSVLTDEQLDQIERYTTIVSPAIPVIETYGGGSIRCMMAEVFLPTT
jgi:hypothetical protein